MPPAVAQGRVVFGTHDGRVIAARTSDGVVVWTRELHGCIASSPRFARASSTSAGRAPRLRQAEGRNGRGRRARPAHGTGALEVRRRERRGEPGDRGEQAVLLGLPEPQGVDRLRDETRTEQARRLELRPGHEDRVEPDAPRATALHRRLRPERLRLRRLERAAQVPDERLRRRHGDARPAEPAQPRPAAIVDRGRLLRDAGGRLSPHLRRRHRRRVLGL
jgi:hypothetical protein